MSTEGSQKSGGQRAPMIINENDISAMSNGGAGYSRGGPQTGMMDQHNRSFGTFNQL